MVNVRSDQKAFSGGEVSPEMVGRVDDPVFQTGLALCRNFVTAPHGPAMNRAGTLFVRETKNSLLRSCVRPFAYSTTQTMALEFGDKYIRFHTQGAILLAGTGTAYSGAVAYVLGDLVSLGGVNYYNIAPCTGVSPPNATNWYPLPDVAYEIPTPYAAADVFDIHWVQSADVLTLTHPSYQPMELRRLGATKWTLVPISFTPALGPPTALAATPTVTGTGLTTQSYVITALSASIGDETQQSNIVSCSNNLNAIAAYNTITWSALTGAARYYVYKFDNGLFGFIGETTGTTLVDDNIIADLSQTPPENVNPYNAAGNYPAAVTYYEQRRAFGGTLNQPQNMVLTKSGTESNLQYSIPTRDDDSIAFKVSAREANTIRHLVPLQNLIMLTSSAEWRITSLSSDALTPASINVKAQSYVGASNVQPVIVNNNLLFAANRGGHVREMTFAYQTATIGAYQTNDICLRATHLFDNKTILDAAFAKSPQPIVWFVSSTGKLLGLTYVPEEKVGAWHQHDTDGTFESCCCVAEGTEDALYVIVNRTIGGVTKRYVERLASRQFLTPADAFFVDAGLSYNGAPTSVLSGLNHLEGKTVSILGDASVRPPQKVVGGTVTLDQPASKAQVGLPITADLQTLPLAFEAQAFGQGRVKNINKVWLKVVASLGIFAGPQFDRLTEAKIRTTEPFGSPPNLQTTEISINLTNEWASSGAVCIRQSDPLPLTIAAMSLEAAIGA